MGKKKIEVTKKYDRVIAIPKERKMDSGDEKSDSKSSKIEELLKIYNDFQRNLNGVDKYFKNTSKIIENEHKKTEKYIRNSIYKNKIHKDEEYIFLGLSNEEYKDFNDRYDYKNILSQKNQIIPKTTLIYFDSLFESFLQKIFIFIYKNNTKFLELHEAKFTYSDLERFETLDNLRHYIVQNKVSLMMWESLEVQIENLLKILGVEKEKEHFLIKELVDISNKRNIFIHNNGEINDIYIKKCKTFGIECEYKNGDKLEISNGFFDVINDVYFEFLVKTIFFCWLVFSDSDLKYDEAIHFLNNIIFRKIKENDLDLAMKIADFLIENKFYKKSGEFTQLYVIINKALIYKKQDKKNRVSEIINNIDWSAKDNIFKMAKSILLEDWKNASKYMKSIIKKEKIEGDNYISENELREWPLFFEFKDTEEFKNEYKKIFGKEFITEL